MNFEPSISGQGLLPADNPQTVHASHIPFFQPDPPHPVPVPSWVSWPDSPSHDLCNTQLSQGAHIQYLPSKHICHAQINSQISDWLF